ncbi:MAG: tetratricopeptide repeat-containing sensor histidine kinase [Bacteroidales bacterium]
MKNSILEQKLAKCLQLIQNQKYSELLPIARAGAAMSGTNLEKLSSFYYYEGCAFQFSEKLNDSATYCFEKSLYFSKKSNFVGQLAITSRQLMFLYYIQNERKKQTLLAEILQSIYKKTTNKKICASLLYAICDYDLYNEHFDTFTNHALDCINLLQSDTVITPQSRKDIGGLYIKISRSFDSMHQLDKAIEYCQLAENQFESLDLEEISITNNLFVRYYVQKGSIEKALLYLSKIEALNTNSSFKELALGNSYNCLAEYYIKVNNLNQSMSFSKKAIKFSELSKDGELLSIAKVLFAKILYYKKEYDKAILVLKAVEYETKKYNKQTYLFLTDILAKCYKAKGDYRNASIYQDKTSLLNDSILKASSNENIAKAEATFQNKLKQEKINSLIAQNKIATLEKMEAKSKLLVLLLCMIIAMLVGGALYFQGRNRKKANVRLQKLNDELDEANRVKMRFFGILNHDLRSPLSNLIQIIELKNSESELIDRPTMSRLEQSALLSATNLLTSMEDMLLWGKGQMSNFEPHIEVVSVGDLFSYIATYFESEKEVSFQFEDYESLLVTTDENILKTILRNLTSNAIKALKTTETPLIIWKAWKQENCICLSITDNGPGISNNQLKALYNVNEVIGVKNGLGLHLIRDLTVLLSCQIELESNNSIGTSFVLKFN